jgi:hypothetical protein
VYTESLRGSAAPHVKVARRRAEDTMRTCCGACEPFRVWTEKKQQALRIKSTSTHSNREEKNTPGSRPLLVRSNSSFRRLISVDKLSKTTRGKD